MKTSVIRQRVADFLEHHAPFDTLSQQDLLDLAGSGKVKFHESDEYLFHRGDPKGPFIWAIQQGRVEVLEETPNGERLRDILGEGDLLGLDRFAGDGAFQYSARTATDVILYGVAAPLFESAVDRYPALRRFVSAHISVSGHLGFNRTSWLEADPPPLDFLRARLQSSGHEPALAPPPATLGPPLTTRRAVHAMLQAHAESLAITADGTPHTPVEAILTALDLSLFCGRDPVRLIDAIRKARSHTEIVPLWQLGLRLVRDGLAQPHDVDDCCLIRAELIAALVTTCIRLAAEDVREAGVTEPVVPYCWLLFGESARGDVLGAGFPAVAAVYDDSHPAFQPEDSLWFTALAGETAGRLHAVGLCGEALDWPEGARPSMPLSEWKRLYSETIRHPLGHDLYARRSFFDFTPLSGDPSIALALQDFIIRELRSHENAVPLWANDTLARVPPLTFFRDVVVDLDGGHQESFDINETVVSPIVSGARVFAMGRQRLAPAHTLARLEAAITDFPDGAGVFRQAAEAFRIGLYYQTLSGDVRIRPARLGKFDRLLLKTAFSSIQRFLQFTVSTFLPDL